MNSELASSPTEVAPLWRLAFRAGFLAAALLAVLGMARWLYWMVWPQTWQSGMSPNWWHAHEMVFGFALPVVAGFLLTAVATWTGTQGTRGRSLQLLFGLWLFARGVLWLAPELAVLAWLAEILFILLTAFELGKRVWARRQTRNMLFLPVLLALAVIDSTSYLYADNPVMATPLHYGAVWMITAFIVIIGGRVTPMFTGNRLGLKITPLPQWFEHLAVASVIVIGLATAFWPQQQAAPWLAPLCLMAGALHLYRLWRWQGWKTLGVPLLWSMHLSYLCIPLALLGLAATGGDPVATKNIIHLLAIGAIGGMILAMMSRVSLGHTGRPLEVPGYLALSFATVILSAIVRAAIPILDASLTFLSWRIAALLWMFAFSCFLIRYLPILTRARVDGKSG